jgi:hypothetical protein
MLSRIPLWGKSGTLDYPTALAKGEVPGPEQRAMGLLRRVCDEYRYSLYCMTGQLPVLGSVTRRLYLALKAGGLLEIVDGRAVAWWCFSIGPFDSTIPDTDHVIVVRAMVEGEEVAFMRTGDRHTYQSFEGELERGPGVADPFVVSLLEGIEWRPDVAINTADLLDLPDLRKKQHPIGRPMAYVIRWDGRPSDRLAEPGAYLTQQDLQFGAPVMMANPACGIGIGNNIQSVQMQGACQAVAF